jgi:GDP-L-fucose synthase
VKIYIAGKSGLVGSALDTESRSRGFDVLGKTSRQLDLSNREAVFQEMHELRPDCLIIAAAKVGGIKANSEFPVEFLSINLQIQTNLMDAAHSAKVKKLLFLGSSCIYPKFAPQPILESALLTGALEPSNEAYAIAKIAGLKLIQSYRKQYGYKWISAMPTNLYGPHDNFDLETSHVIPSLIRRFHNAKTSNSKRLSLWGDGTPMREFLHVTDLAQACMMLLEKYDSDVPINVGSGYEISIGELAKLVAEVVGFKGEVVFETDRLNGTPRKFLNSKLIFDMDWSPRVDLKSGLESTYDWFLENVEGGLKT